MSLNSFGQFVEISKPRLYLSLYRGFLEVYENKVKLDRIPLDDIAGLIITGHGCSHSSNILTALAERGVPVSICGSNFLPKAFVLPVVGNCRQNLRMRSQFSIRKPLKKRLWKQIVQLKLKTQASVLKEYGLAYEGLLRMSALVKSGDTDNLEAQGARRYWVTLFSKDFKREKEGNGVNAMLNYAYAIIRSCVARGVMAAGLHPSVGLHHENIYNSMCLVDDLMEPFRPIGDYVVKQLFMKGYSEVNKEVKEALSKIAVANIFFESDSRPLFHVIAHVSSALAMILSAEKKKWDIDFKIEWNNFHLDILCSSNLEKLSYSA